MQTRVYKSNSPPSQYLFLYIAPPIQLNHHNMHLSSPPRYIQRQFSQYRRGWLARTRSKAFIVQYANMYKAEMRFYKCKYTSIYCTWWWTLLFGDDDDDVGCAMMITLQIPISTAAAAAAATTQRTNFPTRRKAYYFLSCSSTSHGI